MAPSFFVPSSVLHLSAGLRNGFEQTPPGVKCSRNGKEAVERWVDRLSVYGEGA